MNITKRVLLTLLTIAIAYIQTSAIPAYPFPKKIVQPDGTTITIIKDGNEHYHIIKTLDGYPVVETKNGFYNYAKMDNKGYMTDTKVRAKDKALRSKSDVRFLSQLKDATQVEALSQQLMMQKSKHHHDEMVDETHTRASFPRVGTPSSLVILVSYSDVPFTVQNAQQEFTQLLNEEGYSKNGGTGSAKDYFRDNSMGAFVPNFVVVGPYTLPQTLAYYGENDANGRDKNPTQLVVDACKAAHDDGVDFSVYDTDNDGFIDNVFVYYAGYNEAEHGRSETIWPHRWVVSTDFNYEGTDESITFNGKKLYDYACTSELKSNAGGNMCGIGTFTHEFGHVLGLADMYSTNSSRHHTLSLWDIMDAGPYLNAGRTPPAYNAFQRMKLGFMTPTLLTQDTDITLRPINTHNEAYLATETNTHNMDGQNPSPTEYFLFENRQKTGWDTYLPGHGMLAYRINYDPNTWRRNEVNNNPAAMGVDILEADGKADRASLSGDTYPGTSNVTSVNLTLRSGKRLYKKIGNIAENNQIITGRYEKEVVIVPSNPKLIFNAEVNTESFPQDIGIKTANLDPQSALQYALKGKDSDQFSVVGDGKLPTEGGVIKLSFTPTKVGEKTAQLVISSPETTTTVQLIGVANMAMLEKPIVPTSTDQLDIAEQGFKAVWQEVNNATHYQVNVYTKTDGGEVKTKLEEDFILFTKGNSNGTPDPTDISQNINDYMRYIGWDGNSLYEAGGSIKIGTNKGTGFLETPKMNLTKEGGTFHLYFDVATLKGQTPSLKIYHKNRLLKEITDLKVADHQFTSMSMEIEGGTDQSTLRWETTNSSFMVDNIKITQGKERKNIAIKNAPFETDKLFYNVEGLIASQPYYYSIIAHNKEQISFPSEEVGPIALSSTGIFSTKAPTLTIWTTKEHIFFNAEQGDIIQLFDIVGHKVHQQVATKGINKIPTAPYKGTLLIKVGDRVGKVVR